MCENFTEIFMKKRRMGRKMFWLYPALNTYSSLLISACKTMPELLKENFEIHLLNSFSLSVKVNDEDLIYSMKSPVMVFQKIIRLY
jgi:starvation-inducible outer membrane lipoprotein